MLLNFSLLLLSFLPTHQIDTSRFINKDINISGAVDIYYAYDFNRPEDKNRQYTTQAARHNEFNINWAYIQLDYLSDNVRGSLALHSGTYVIFNYADEPNQLLKFIAQANAGFRLAPKFWLDAGILPSHIGYESTLSAANEIYTRSLMAEHSPYFSTGAQLTAELSDKLTAKIVILNGWQNITETNNSKSYGININYKPISKLELNYSNYLGNEGNEIIGRKMRIFNHAYVKYTFSSKFHSVISFDIGNQELLSDDKRRTWHTGMFISRYQLNDKFSLTGRIEYYNDPYNIMISTPDFLKFEVSSTTLNFNYHPSSNSVLRLAGRMYNASETIFGEGINAVNHNFLLVSSLTLHF